MANTLKNLGGGRNPSAATLEDLYTVPAVTSALVSSLVVANRSATPTAFRIAHALAGAANDNKQYLAYDAAIGANDIVVMTLGLTMATTDVLRVYATLATLSFNAFGEEIT